MLIRKTQQPSTYPENQIHDAYSTSATDTYSCNYLNNMPLEKVLYDANGSPKAGSVTLSDSKSNYDELCISGWSNSGALFNVKVPTNNTQFRISVVDNNGSGTNAWLKQTVYKLEDKKITMLSALWREINSSQHGTDDALRINKVIGIKSTKRL